MGANIRTDSKGNGVKFHVIVNPSVADSIQSTTSKQTEKQKPR